MHTHTSAVLVCLIGTLSTLPGVRSADDCGIVLYEGPSLLTGEPIVVLATLDSGNGKTGPMVQTWTMRADEPPHVAAKAGRDPAVCGDCPHRSKTSGGAGSCYVTLIHGPRSAWAAYKRGRYARPNDETYQRTLGALVRVAMEHGVRVGSYGDPAAAPYDAWSPLWGVIDAYDVLHTGYTHQWRSCDTRWRGRVMASADTLVDATGAWARGWRTYRVVSDETTPLRTDAGEIGCPSDTRAIQCRTCGLCAGTTSRARSVVIAAHGSGAALAPVAGA